MYWTWILIKSPMTHLISTGVDWIIPSCARTDKLRGGGGVRKDETTHSFHGLLIWVYLEDIPLDIHSPYQE